MTEPAPVPIVLFASGRGTGFESIAQAVATGALRAEILALVCDRPGALAIDRARARGIAVIEHEYPKDCDRAVRDAELLTKVKALGPRFLVFAGYMRLVSRELLDAFRAPAGYTRVVNIHPSLLPAFPGVGAYEQAFRHGCMVAGVSVHLVEPAMDSGPICAQEAFSIAACRSADEVEKLGLAIEHRLYPETLAWVLPEKFEVEAGIKGRLRVRAH